MLNQALGGLYYRSLFVDLPKVLQLITLVPTLILVLLEEGGWWAGASGGRGQGGRGMDHTRHTSCKPYLEILDSLFGE